MAIRLLPLPTQRKNLLISLLLCGTSLDTISYPRLFLHFFFFYDFLMQSFDDLAQFFALCVHYNLGDPLPMNISQMLLRILEADVVLAARKLFVEE